MVSQYLPNGGGSATNEGVTDAHWMSVYVCGGIYYNSQHLPTTQDNIQTRSLRQIEQRVQYNVRYDATRTHI